MSGFLISCAIRRAASVQAASFCALTRSERSSSTTICPAARPASSRSSERFTSNVRRSPPRTRASSTPSWPRGAGSAMSSARRERPSSAQASPTARPTSSVSRWRRSDSAAPFADRIRPSRSIAARLEELRPPIDVGLLAVREVEPQRVELSTGHRYRQAGAVARILQREEHRLPAGLTPQLGDLAFDPDRRQSRQPACDAAIERRHGVNLAIAVLLRLDLHEARIRAKPSPLRGESRLRPSRRSLA